VLSLSFSLFLSLSLSLWYSPPGVLVLRGARCTSVPPVRACVAQRGGGAVLLSPRIPVNERYVRERGGGVGGGGMSFDLGILSVCV